MYQWFDPTHLLEFVLCFIFTRVRREAGHPRRTQWGRRERPPYEYFAIFLYSCRKAVPQYRRVPGVHTPCIVQALRAALWKHVKPLITPRSNRIPLRHRFVMVLQLVVPKAKQTQSPHVPACTSRSRHPHLHRSLGLTDDRTCRLRWHRAL